MSILTTPTGRWHWTTRRFPAWPGSCSFTPGVASPTSSLRPASPPWADPAWGRHCPTPTSRITYHNGAVVNTAFATSYGPNLVEIAPRSRRGHQDRPAQGPHHQADDLPVPAQPADYPGCACIGPTRRALRAAPPGGGVHPCLDEMKAEGKEAFGCALLISDAAASRKALLSRPSRTPTPPPGCGAFRAGNENC